MVCWTSGKNIWLNDHISQTSHTVISARFPLLTIMDRMWCYWRKIKSTKLNTVYIYIYIHICFLFIDVFTFFLLLIYLCIWYSFLCAQYNQGNTVFVTKRFDDHPSSWLMLTNLSHSQVIFVWYSRRDKVLRNCTFQGFVQLQIKTYKSNMFL